MREDTAARAVDAALRHEAVDVTCPAMIEKWNCSRIVVKVDSMAMPIEPPRLRIMLKIAEACALLRGWRLPVASEDSGTMMKGWPSARTSCGSA